jgi:methionyl aminopeptidase
VASGALPKSNDPCWCGSGRKYKRCHKALEGRVLPAAVSPMLNVPDGITPTDYYRTGRPNKWNEPMVKSEDVLARMRVAGRVAAEVLAATGAAVAPGVTTDELDVVAHHAYLERGAYPSTLNYHGYPKSICTSVNEVICHGIPDDRPLQDGDIVNIDVTAYIGGVHGDCNATFYVGDVDDMSRRLVEVTRECRALGIGAVAPGRPISDVGRAIQAHAEKHGYGVVRTFVGHGIGEQFHTAPSVPHYYSPDATTVMQPGMTFTVEPMITLGTWREKMWNNGWTAVTADGKRTAQFEHTLVVTEDGAEVLTLEP